MIGQKDRTSPADKRTPKETGQEKEKPNSVALAEAGKKYDRPRICQIIDDWAD
jgi:hypothetical protein